MLTLNFSRIFKLRKIDRPFRFLVMLGLSENYASRIANSRVRNINVDQMERLCLIFNCTPNDLFDWTPDKKLSDPDSYSLADLWRKEKGEGMKELYQKLPLNKLIEIEALISEQLKK